LVLIFNGEIFNHRELRKRLEEAAHVFWNGTFPENEKQQLCCHYDPRVLITILGLMRKTTGIERYLEFDQGVYLPDDILSQG